MAFLRRNRTRAPKPEIQKEEIQTQAPRPEIQKEEIQTRGPKLEIQKEEIHGYLNQELKEGDTWCLVEVRWMKMWKEFVGYDLPDQSHESAAVMMLRGQSPGPIQTSSLFAGTATDQLKDHLKEEFDYSLVPEKGWEKLVEWYGLAADSRPIPRKVIEYGLYKEHHEVEVYLLNVKLAMHPILTEHVVKEFSRGETVGDLEAALREVYAIPAETPCRVWHRYMSNTYELLNDSSQTLQDAGLYNMQTIVIEKQYCNGVWPSGSQGLLTRSLSTATRNEPPQQKQCSLLNRQQLQHEAPVQSVATEQKEAIQASRQAQEVPNRLPRQENNIQFLRKNIEDNASQLEGLLTEEQRKRAEAEQNAAAAIQRAETLEEGIRQQDIQLQEVTKSLQAVEEEKNGLRERKEAAQSRIGTLETELQSVQQQRDDVTRQLQEILQRLHETEQQFRDTTQQLNDTSQQLRDSEQRLLDTSQQLRDSEQRLHDAEQQFRNSEQRHQETEQRLQQAYQRADQQQERATTAETRLQHSDQVFQDILQRLIGQLPQSQPHWVVKRDEIELLDEELGSGGWATVRVGKFRGNRVAAKCLHRQIVSAHNVRLFTREMNMAANARHPNLLQFIGATLDNQEPIIVTELMPTSLRRVMEEGTRLTHPQIVSVACQVALALNYLHLTQPKAIIHRDVSSSNVLLKSLPPSWIAKLSDYGSANFVRHTTTAGPGNPTYAAPEANNPEQHSAKMDVFSFGVLLVEMCSGELAPEEHRDRLLAAIQWPAMVGLIQQCLKYEPHRRPDMSGVSTQLEQFLFFSV